MIHTPGLPLAARRGRTVSGSSPGAGRLPKPAIGQDEVDDIGDRRVRKRRRRLRGGQFPRQGPPGGSRPAMRAGSARIAASTISASGSGSPPRWRETPPPKRGRNIGEIDGKPEGLVQRPTSSPSPRCSSRAGEAWRPARAAVSSAAPANRPKRRRLRRPSAASRPPPCPPPSPGARISQAAQDVIL